MARRRAYARETYEPEAVTGSTDLPGVDIYEAAQGNDYARTSAPPNVAPGEPTPGVPPTSSASSLGQWANMLEGFDLGKLQSGHDSPKYQFGRVMSQFDPTKGITQELLDALNKLGLGTVSGSGDKLRIGGNVDPRFEGITEFDIARDLGKGGWQWQGIGGPGYQPSGGGGGYTPSAATGGSYGGGGGGGTTTSTTRTAPTFDSLKQTLEGLFPGGLFNQDVVTRRTSNIADALTRQRKSQTASNQAALAERGLIGSGPEASAMQNLDDRMFQTFTSGVNEAYATEGENADQRMMQALQIAAGMTAEEARNAVDWFRANTEKELGLGQLDLGRGRLGLDERLGMGNLALGNLRAGQDYNLGMGRLGLDRDALMYNLQNTDIDRLLEIARILMGGSGTAAGGYRTR